MSPKRWDVYLVDPCAAGTVNYERPCIILRVEQSGKVVVLPTSSKRELYLTLIKHHFALTKAMHGFSQSGFDQCSYAISNYMQCVPVSSLKQPPIGRLRGDIARGVPYWLKHINDPGYDQEIVWKQA